MEILFQKFIANLLSKRLGEENALYQRAEYIDINRKLRITPDIELLRDNKIAIIMDTKYKQLGSRNPPSDHIMQVYSYSAGTKTKKCILLYASTTEIRKTEHLLVGDIWLFTVHFNIASSSSKEFDLNCSKIIDEIMNIMRI